MDESRADVADLSRVHVAAVADQGPGFALRLPGRIPLAVRQSEFVSNLIAAAAGTAAGLTLSAALSSMSGASQSWARLFALDGAQAIIPVAMLCMFFWGLASCVLRAARVAGQARLSGATALNELLGLANDPSVSLGALGAALRVPAAGASPLHRRIRVVVQQWLLQPDLTAALSLVDQQAVADEDAVRRGYGTMKTFVWALPVLGLIGTVFGIASAVGEFSSFLGTQVEDVTTIKQALVGVTGGLAFAFAITIVGLVASLLLMLPAAALQAKEERFFGGLQAMVAEDFLATLQRRFPARAAAPEPMQSFREAMQEVGRDVIRSVGATLTQTGNAIATTLGHGLATGSSANERVAASLVQEVAALRQAAAEAMRAHESAFERHGTHLAAVQDQLGSALERQSGAVAVVTDQLSQLAERAGATLEGLRAASAGLQSLEPLTAGLREAAAAADRLGAQHANHDAAVQRLLEAQRAMEAALAHLDAAGWTRSLTTLGEHLERTSQVLRAFQEPMYLQAVPARALRPSAQP